MVTIDRSPKQARRTRSKKILNGHNAPVYDRPHRCTIGACQRSFTRAEHLKRHQLNHDSTHAWSCDRCSVTFVRKDLWNRHLRVSHGERSFSSLTDRQSATSTGSERLRDESNSPNSTIEAEGYLGDTNSEPDPGTSRGQMDSSMHRDNLPLAQKRNSQMQSIDDLDMMLAPFEASWIPDLENWRSEIHSNRGSRLTDTDMDWFFQNQDMSALDGDQIWNEDDSGPSDNISFDLPQEAPRNSPAEAAKVKRPPPAYLQDLQTKIYVAKSGQLEAPTCGFRICNALTDERRIELLMHVRNLVEVDLNDPIFSLNSMKQGIHLFCRNVAIEYPFVHPEVLCPSSNQSRHIMKQVFGEEPGPQLIWAAITLGWTLMRSDNNHEWYMASKIQRVIRASIINHPGLANIPPLWLVQSLFLVLLFARYQGTREEYGFASTFHGVLLEATRRLDYRSDRMGIQSDGVKDSIASLRVWIIWIKAETIRRYFFELQIPLILQTFILDVKHAILYGAETSMTPFELNLKLPFCEDAFYATNPTDWANIMSVQSDEPVPFLPRLKRFWSLQSSKMLTEALPRGGDVIMYGLIWIARELARREDNSLSNRSSNALLSLGNTVRRSFEIWEVAWKQIPISDGMRSWNWRNCSCVIRLAHTLYEIGPVDLQTVAGKEIIEGKRRGAADYAWSKRKLRQWVKHDRAALGLHCEYITFTIKITQRLWSLKQSKADHLSTDAALVIREHLNGESGGTHCHHCLWCLYLAALVCWNFGFTLTKATTDSQDLIKDGQVVEMGRAERECQEYLHAAVNIHHGHRPERMQALTRPTGMMIVLIGFLRSRCETGMIEESIEHLTRLAGLSTPLPVVQTPTPTA
ncbi:hypothetical protein A1O1_05683 [Capronia coronata CBS 617.96]|uniref:C2H2-type domain-containing protein n=1 Tax=Capronia coronata CBS 617.96 TaxID=1182541 RepID=W9YHK6_9EURO|nr:uncharacterized protein A1O1_05683 [Capronia coronata CBS 617.96]EXJ88751.1 hypothetical protein A1O1_05683 [Capronia coronata CBS 617.96]